MDSTLALGHGPLRIERIRILVFLLTGPSSEQQELIRQINSSDNQIALWIDFICQYADNFNNDYDQGDSTLRGALGPGCRRLWHKRGCF